VSYKLLLLTFLGVVCGMGLRTGSAFRDVSSLVTFMALLTLGFSVGRALSSMLSGEAVKKYGSRVTGAGFILLAIVGIGYALGPINLYPVLRVFHGISSGITWSSMQALVLNLAPPDKRARVSSLYFFIGTLGVSFAYVLGSIFTIYILYISPSILFILGLYTMRISTEIGIVEKKTSEKVFTPPSVTLFLMSFVTGLLNVLVNSEVTIALLYASFGKIGTGLLLGVASLGGTFISYLLGKELLDIRQSEYSLIFPSLSSLCSASFILFSNNWLTFIGILFTQGSITWWRSLLLAAARSGDVGRRIGLVNAGRDLGSITSALLMSGGMSVSTPLILGILISSVSILYMKRNLMFK